MCRFLMIAAALALAGCYPTHWKVEEGGREYSGTNTTAVEGAYAYSVVRTTDAHVDEMNEGIEGEKERRIGRSHERTALLQLLHKEVNKESPDFTRVKELVQLLDDMDLQGRPSWRSWYRGGYATYEGVGYIDRKVEPDLRFFGR